jgi:DNA-binding IclR family transcriptional regulator
MQKSEPEDTRDSAGKIQVLTRAAAVLDILARSDGPTRLQVISEESGLVPSTVRRILVSLCELGFCEQTSTGSYRLGLRLFELGKRVEARFDLRAISREPLERLSELTDLTVFLTVRHEDRGVAIERIDGKYAFSLALTVGGSLPLHVGAAPRALLAAEPEAAIRSYVQRAETHVRYTDKTVVDPNQLIADILEARARGYVISNEDVTPGVAAIGVAVYGHEATHTPVAAISVAGLVPHILGEDHERILGQLRETADTISRQLGYGTQPVLAAARARPRSATGAA